MTLTISGNEAHFQSAEPGSKGETYLFKLDPGQDPKSIDLVKKATGLGRGHGDLPARRGQVDAGGGRQAAAAHGVRGGGPRQRTAAAAQGGRQAEEGVAPSDEVLFELAELRGKVKKLEAKGDALTRLLEQAQKGTPCALKAVDVDKNTVSVVLRGTTFGAGASGRRRRREVYPRRQGVPHRRAEAGDAGQRRVDGLGRQDPGRRRPRIEREEGRVVGCRRLRLSIFVLSRKRQRPLRYRRGGRRSAPAPSRTGRPRPGTRGRGWRRLSVMIGASGSRLKATMVARGPM